MDIFGPTIVFSMAADAYELIGMMIYIGRIVLVVIVIPWLWNFFWCCKCHKLIFSEYNMVMANKKPGTTECSGW